MSTDKSYVYDRDLQLANTYFAINNHKNIL